MVPLCNEFLSSILDDHLSNVFYLRVCRDDINQLHLVLKSKEQSHRLASIKNPGFLLAYYWAWCFKIVTSLRRVGHPITPASHFPRARRNLLCYIFLHVQFLQKHQSHCREPDSLQYQKVTCEKPNETERILIQYAFKIFKTSTRSWEKLY